MPGEDGAQGRVHGAQSLITAVRLLHGHEVEPETFEKGVESAGDMARVVRIAPVANDASAELEGEGGIFLVIGGTMFLIGRAALAFGPEGAPGGEQPLRAYSLVEVCGEKVRELVSGRWPGREERLLPIGTIVLSQGFERLDQQLFL